MARTIALWVFGLLASAIFGAMIGPYLQHEVGHIFGALGAMLAFACVRLWLAAPPKKSN